LPHAVVGAPFKCPLNWASPWTFRGLASVLNTV
jgi:hypothetical protein